MARIAGGIAGIPSGKLGNVVFVNREGSPYIRMAPEYTKSSWTPAQKQHRERFKLVSTFCRQFRTNIIRPVWNLVPGKASGYSKFLKANMPAFGKDGKLTDRSLLRFSDGALPLPFHLKVETVENEPDKIRVTWENDAMMPYRYTQDELLMITAAGNIFKGPYETGLKRTGKSGILNLGSEVTDAVYLFFASDDRKRYSPDRYFSLQL